MNVTDFLIIDNKDSQGDNYRIQEGLFFSDHALVSTIALSCPVDADTELEYLYKYIPIPSTDFEIKYNVQSRSIVGYDDAKVSYKSKTYACAEITQNVYSSDINSDLYLRQTVQELLDETTQVLSSIVVVDTILGVEISSCEFTDNDADTCNLGSCYNIADPNVSLTDDLVGGSVNTGSESISGVNACLIVPTPYDQAGNFGEKSFTYFTLSGGVEAPRFTLYLPPTAIVTVSLKSTSDLSEVSKDFIIDYYENSANIYNTNNVVDNWYVDVTGFMWPNQYLYEFWNVKWTVSNDAGDVIPLTAKYINRSTGLVGVDYDGQVETVDGNPTALDEQIDNIRFYFDTPGVKQIDFSIVDDSNENPLWTYSLCTENLNNTNDLEVIFVSSDAFQTPNSLSLSAVSFYNQGQTLIELDSEYPDIKWLWENLSGNQNGITVENVKSGGSVAYNTLSVATDADYVKFNATEPNIYTISAVNGDSLLYDTYTWSNFSPSSISLEYEFNNCPINRVVSISALTNFEGNKILFDGIDEVGDPVYIQWSWDSDNITAKSDTQRITNGDFSVALETSEIQVSFTDESSLTPTLCSTVFTASASYLDNVDLQWSDEISVDYDLLPKGFELDVDINFENSNDIDNTYYRIVDEDDLTVNFKGNIKPDDSTGWLDGSELYDLVSSQPSSVLWYLNGDIDNVLIYNNNCQLSFDMTTENYHISSITFLLSCLSASPVFGYGHSLERTIDLKIYKDSFIPTVSSVLFPEYQWRLPSTPAVSALGENPNLYWVETPYPSAYGEGKTNVFLGSAFSNDAGGDFFDESSWYPDAELYEQTINEDSLLELRIQSNADEEQSISGVVGAFNSSISLLNDTLSTYKDDFDGSIQVFKNWKYWDDPILITNYESSTSQEITLNKDVSDVNVVNFKFNTNVYYPNYSPVRINRGRQTVTWAITSDTGQDFSGESVLGEDYIIRLSPQTFIRNLFVGANISAKEYIPDQLGYTLNSRLKDVNFNLPVEVFPISILDFTLSAVDSNCISDTQTRVITAFAPVDLEGLILTEYPNDDFNWIVDGVDLGTNVPFLTTIDGYSMHRADADYLGHIIPIELTIDNDLNLKRTKQLHVNPPVQLDWRFFANNTIALTGQETYFYNDTQTPLPVSSFLYNFEGEDEIYNVSSGDIFFKSFDEVGSKNVYISAVDVKGFVDEVLLTNVIKVIDNYNTYIEDQFTGSEVGLKNNFENIKIAPNEWSASSVINNSITNIYDNLLFLENISKFYDKPPYGLLGWFGANGTTFKWNISPWDSNYNVVSLEGNTPDNLLSYNVIDDDMLLLTYSDKLELRENNYTSNLIFSIGERSVNNSFTDIKNSVTDSNGNIILLDAFNFGTVIIYDVNLNLRNPFKFIASFGGLGGPDSKNKFKGANDISIDSNDILYIADTGNRVIKQFTNTGGFLGKFESYIFNPDNSEEEGNIENGSVISASMGDNDILYGLNNKFVVLFDNDTKTQISFFDWSDRGEGLTPVRISASKDDNILYVICEEKIIKFTKDGLFIGYIGEFPNEYSSNIPSFKYSNYNQGADRVGYLVSSSFVVKYTDIISYLFIKPVLKNEWWQLHNLTIEDYEYVEYWVYNKSFSRIWENFEYFRESLLARVLFSFDINNKQIFNLYNRADIYRPEYTYSKEDVLIGVNELVTAEVVNRCLSRIQKCSLELLDMITSQTSRYRWVDTIEVGFNPTTWKSTKQTGKHPIKWGEGNS